MLKRFAERFGPGTCLKAVTGEEIHTFVLSLGGKKETKQRHLGPISSLYSWAIREGLLTGNNPAHGLVFWREPGERSKSRVVRYYSEKEFSLLLDAAAGDEMVLDALHFGRYLACRRHDMVMLRWEDWKWRSCIAEVHRMKTLEAGIEVSLVDLHPVLRERYGHRRGQQGFCIEYVRQRRTHVDWPTDEALVRLVQVSSRSAVARNLGCSEAAVRKRLKRIATSGPHADEERQLLAETLTKRVRKVTEAAGLYVKGVQPLHVLRHTFASDALGRGIPVATVAKWMGISPQTLLDNYHHLIPRGELGNRSTNLWDLTA